MSKLDDILQRHAKELEEYFKKGGEENFYVPKNEATKAKIGNLYGEIIDGDFYPADNQLGWIKHEFKKVAKDKDTLFRALNEEEEPDQVVWDFIDSFTETEYPQLKEIALVFSPDTRGELFNEYLNINNLEIDDDNVIKVKIGGYVKSEKDDALKPYIKNLDYKSKEEKFYVSDSKRDFKNPNLNIEGFSIIEDTKGGILYESQNQHEEFKQLVQEAVEVGVSLKRANLFKADLRDISLSLKKADLREADLRDADLSGANLYGTNLEGANLEGSNLASANLEDADLEDANLKGANLEDANLNGANLEVANLEDANLEDAYLEDANLEGANLEGANLTRHDLSDLRKRGATGV